ncbi:PQQ-dependent sugar dehydrogenase [Pontibacter sp. H249]|uniref:PQQ-dependent sugar dehydrogenase n=1 Tax=Pontibacter sp. H249 TaxID=3133420 RepID=UPI0030C4252D
MKTLLQEIFFILLLTSSFKPALAQEYTLREAYPAAPFTNQLEAVVGNNDSRLYVVEQGGSIYWLPTESKATAQPTLFLDISGRVVAGGEAGLLGLALHPDYETNGYFYVNYTTGNPLQTRISRFTATAANTADPGSEVVLLTYEQPFANHNGGKIAFGPDGYLYISSGDGGSAGDPQNNAQNLASLLGKILRIDINAATEGRSYGIPADNPFANNTSGYREEIYAYGFRNVWKFSFDETTDLLLAADVGQGTREEINKVNNGGNYGWRIMEGSACYTPSSNCNTSGLILPVFDYTHASGAGRSITGGYIYRGNLLPELQGKYIYGDYVSGNIWALTLNPDGTAGANTLLLNAGFLVSSFAVDEENELLVLSYGTGRKIFRLSSDAVTGIADELSAYLEVYPNPATTRLHIKLDPSVANGLPQYLYLYNATGQLTQTKILNRIASEAELEVGHLPKGIYHLRLQTDKGSTFKKIVLQ